MGMGFGLLLPELDQLPPRGNAAGDMDVVFIAYRLAPLTARCEVGGEGVVQLAGEHAAPVLGGVDGAEHGDAEERNRRKLCKGCKMLCRHTKLG